MNNPESSTTIRRSLFFNADSSANLAMFSGLGSWISTFAALICWILIPKGARIELASRNLLLFSVRNQTLSLPDGEVASPPRYFPRLYQAGSENFLSRCSPVAPGHCLDEGDVSRRWLAAIDL